jgi:hypothetical protein
MPGKRRAAANKEKGIRPPVIVGKTGAEKERVHLHETTSTIRSAAAHHF